MRFFITDWLMCLRMYIWCNAKSKLQIILCVKEVCDDVYLLVSFLLLVLKIQAATRQLIEEPVRF